MIPHTANQRPYALRVLSPPTSSPSVLVNNSRGMLSLDMVFGLTLTIGIMVILFAFALTLSVVETVQYVAFASSRSYFAGHQTADLQMQMGQAKFVQLQKAKGIGNLLNKNWFDVQSAFGDFRKDYEDTSQFIGAQIQINAKLLDFQIPFFGSTTGGGGGFKSKVNSFIGREPSSDECMQFFSNRWQNILKMTPQSAQGAAYNLAKDGNDNLPMDDNGC